MASFFFVYVVEWWLLGSGGGLSLVHVACTVSLLCAINSCTSLVRCICSLLQHLELLPSLTLSIS